MPDVGGLDVGHDELEGEVLRRLGDNRGNLALQPQDDIEGRIGKVIVTPRRQGVMGGLGRKPCRVKRPERAFRRATRVGHGGKVGEVGEVEPGGISTSG